MANSETIKDLFLQQLQLHKRIVYKICHAYCKNKDDIEDLAQEIIYQLWKSFDRYDATYKFSTWMYRIALNTAISFYRSTKKNHHHYLDQLQVVEMAAAGEETDMETNLNLLQQCISQLKELDKALMILYLEENSYREIAEITGITESNVATKISRIKEKLKQKISSQIDTHARS